MPQTFVPASIRLDPKLKEKLKIHAKRKRWSLTTLIVAALEMWLMSEDKRK